MEILFIIGIFSMFAIYFFTYAFYLKKTKKHRLYTLSISCLLVGYIIVFIFGSIGIGNIIMTKLNLEGIDTSKQTTYTKYTIENYKVVMNVNENNTIDVNEYITIDFHYGGEHGIYHFIPTWLKYTDKNGNVMSRRANITNLKAVGEEYTVDMVKNKKRIRIGDANRTVPPGLHNYEIKYTYNMGNDPYVGFDELIFHAFGDHWETKINNASLEIHLPKAIRSNSNVHFFLDKFRKNDVTPYINYYISNNTIYANVPSNHSLDGALTVDLELPEGYFTHTQSTYGYKSLLVSFVCIAFAIASISLWKKHGKDLDKVPETVEFYPPEQLDAAEIGYLYKNDTGRKLTIALIVELASKGFIKIIESEDKTKLTIIKANPKDTRMTQNEELVYNKLFEKSDETVLSENTTFYTVFSKVNKNVSNTFDDKINDIVAYKNMLKTSIYFLICSILWALSYCVFEDLNPKINILYAISFASVIIISLFSLIMKRKNLYGEQIMSKISGFKHYIELAEKEQIDALAEKNPNYFYDILPYAYVLNVSKAWIKKFENIPMPTSDMGNFDFHNIDSLDSLSNSVYYPSSSGSSSSSCGGGSSSCGGGCSSCGGGGTW